MSKIDDKLNRVFDIAEQLPRNDITPSTHLPAVDATKEDKDADYELARNNFHLLIEKGNTAIEGILQLAREAENPRSYEVAGQLIKTVSDVTQDLLRLQKNMKELKKEVGLASKNSSTNGNKVTEFGPKLTALIKRIDKLEKKQYEQSFDIAKEGLKLIPASAY